MQIRRPIVAVLTALTLVGGGTLTACGDPVNSDTGTPKDTAENTSGSDPSDESQGNVPDNSDKEQDSDTGQNSPDDQN
jgi:hypothetical protein